jgi:hypothetical protein
MGIPDDFDGPSASYSHRGIFSLPSYTAGNDVYLMQLPIPGMAFWFAQRAAGSMSGALSFTPFRYDGATTLFPTTYQTTNAQKFRYASNVIELVPTVNEMSWGGSIQVWKSKIAMTGEPVLGTASSTVSLVPIMTGWNTLAGAEPSVVFPFKDGVYVPAFNTDNDYEWTVIPEGFTYASLATNQALAADPLDALVTLNTSGSMLFTGLGSFEATIIKLPALPTGQSAVIRCWSCIEYLINPYSILYPFLRNSPQHDVVAMALLKEYRRRIPCGVPFRDNASFWEGFVKWVRGAGRLASFLPGPIGTIGKGVTELVDLGTGLF